MEPIVEDTKEQKKLKKQQEKELIEKENKYFLDSECFFFFYQKLDNRPPTRDYRLNLQKMICYQLYKKKIKEIPNDFKIKIKFGSEYNIIFENKEDFMEIDPNYIFDKSRFKWLKNIEENVIE